MAQKYVVDIVTHKDAPTEIDQFVRSARLMFESVGAKVSTLDAADPDALEGLPFEVKEVPCVVVHCPGSPSLPSVRVGTCPQRMLELWALRLGETVNFK